MNSIPKHRRKPRPVKDAYQPPRLKKLGSVSELTLKIGSDSDFMGGHIQ